MGVCRFTRVLVKKRRCTEVPWRASLVLAASGAGAGRGTVQGRPRRTSREESGKPREPAVHVNLRTGCRGPGEEAHCAHSRCHIQGYKRMSIIQTNWGLTI